MEIKIKIKDRPLLISSILFLLINLILIYLNNLQNVFFIVLMNFLILINVLLFYSIGKFKRESEILSKTLFYPYIETILLLFTTYLMNYLITASGVLWENIWFFVLPLPLLSSNIFILYSYNKKGLIDDSFLFDNKDRYVKIVSISTTIAIAIIVILILSPFIFVLSDHLLTDNEKEISELVNKITKYDDDTNKTISLLNWFDRGKNKQENFSNIYYREKQEDNEILLNIQNNWYIFSKPPYFCCRGNEATWIYSAKCGRCGEVGTLFNYMANMAELDVRKIICSGEDHVWNEINISGEWIIIDATAVNLPDRTGFNLSNTFMENKIKGEYDEENKPEEGNVSYVYAIYPNSDDKIDITNRYTNTTNITLKTTNSENISIDNVTIKVFSLNSAKENLHDNLILKRKTNESGFYTLTLGDGRYRFLAEKEGIKANITKSFPLKNWNYSITIQLS